MYWLYHCTDILQACLFFPPPPLPLPSPSCIGWRWPCGWRWCADLGGTCSCRSWGGCCSECQGRSCWRWVAPGGGQLSLAGSLLSCDYHTFAIGHWLHIHGLAVNQPFAAKGVGGSSGYWVWCCTSACPSWSGSRSSPDYHAGQVDLVPWAADDPASSCCGSQRQRKDFFS